MARKKRKTHPAGRHEAAADRAASERFTEALRLHRAGDLAGAETRYREVLADRPNHADARHLLGLVHHQRGDHETAARLIRRAIEAAPGIAQYHYNLGVALHEWGGHEPAALAAYARAAELKPDYVDALDNMGMLLTQMGRDHEAAATYDRALARNPTSRIRLRRAVLLPAIMGTREEVLAERAALRRRVDDLIADPPRLHDPLRDTGLTSFFLAYHGENDRELQARVAEMYSRIYPALRKVAPHCREPRPRGDGPRRVGFVSNFFFQHSVTRCYARTIELLAHHDDLAATVISFAGNREDAVTRRLAAAARGGRICVPATLEAAAEAIGALELDVLVFLDIGMSMFSYLLAFARMAPVQAVMCGHPVTTGIPTIDCFISWDGPEPADAELHYTERLVRLPRGGLIFERPQPPERLARRAELGLPVDRRLYVCPVKLQKIHPDFDGALVQILARDPQGEILFFEDGLMPPWSRQLSARFDRTVPDELRPRIRFLPWAEADRFPAVLAAADVAIDPWHFGTHSTAVMLYAVGTPMVTWPGRFLRERVGMWMNRVVGIPECIAERREDYAELAVRIARDPGRRNELGSRARANLEQLCACDEAADELADWLRNPAT